MSVEALTRKLNSRDATVAVIGQGYVGLPLSMELAHAGFRTIGVDVDADKVARLNAGDSYIFDVSAADLAKAREDGRFEATTDYARIAEADAVSICVPTPLRKTRDPDISYIQKAAQAMAPHLTGPVLVVLESTTYPGTTEEVLVPLLEESGLTLDEELFVAFSPERVDPGNETYGLRNTPKVVGGVTADSTRLIEALYTQVVENVHPVGGSSEAELVKLLENTFRAVNIALVNEMAMMCDRMDIDIWSVIEAAATKPFGFMPFYPGPGIGGHCIPLDPTYLSWKAKSYGYYNRFIELATDINGNMPRFVVQKLVREMNARGVATGGAKILLLGVAYKSDINDLRESPALDIWQLLESEWGADVSYHDPFIEAIELFDATSSDLTAETLAEVDAVLVTTSHSDVDYDFVAEHASLILDTRNAVRIQADHIVHL
jgi:UDP-N-acetyl-D-glucosamine dehydrogenase